VKTFEELVEKFIREGLHPWEAEEAAAITLGESEGCTVVRDDEDHYY
jgi:hypothetical protein